MPHVLSLARLARTVFGLVGRRGPWFWFLSDCLAVVGAFFVLGAGPFAFVGACALGVALYVFRARRARRYVGARRAGGY